MSVFISTEADASYLRYVPVPGARRAAGCPLCSAGEEDDGRWREAAGCFYCCSHSTTSASSPLKTEAPGETRPDYIKPGTAKTDQVPFFKQGQLSYPD